MAQPLIGTVVSTKMQKTIVVSVERKFRHPMYRKVITRHKKFKVHSEDKNIQEGDLVMIKETKPISKDKHYMLMQKLEDTALAMKSKAKISRQI